LKVAVARRPRFMGAVEDRRTQDGSSKAKWTFPAKENGLGATY
jgi:hypothetical protein